MHKLQMKMKSAPLLALLAFSAAAAPAWGRVATPDPRPTPAEAPSPGTYVIDPVHSQVMFKVKHLGISTVTGRFKEFGGTITFDPAKPAATRAEGTIKAASIDTNNERRDNHLRSADFFESDKHPEITFRSGTIRRGGNNKLKADGSLTMHGVTRPVVLDVEYIGPVPGPDGKDRVAFNATTRVDRMDYGLNWSKAMETGGLVVSREVDIILETQAIRQN